MRGNLNKRPQPPKNIPRVVTIGNTHERSDILHLWTLNNWEKNYLNSECVRTGIRLNFDKGVNLEVKRACKEFCKWARKSYYFPIRIPVYIKSSAKIKAMDGEYVSATFFEPYDRYDEPYIRVSTGDYEDMLKKRGQDNALAAILRSIAHELSHYYQWINDVKLTEVGEERQAKSYADFILNEYAETREHP